MLNLWRGACEVKQRDASASSDLLLQRQEQVGFRYQRVAGLRAGVAWATAAPGFAASRASVFSA